MKKIIFALLFLAGCMLFTSCKKENGCDDCNSNPPTTNNKPPVASAGPDQIITLPTDSATLNGSNSFDHDNNIASYVWTKISGPSSFSIVNTTAVHTQVMKLEQGTYQFELKITDSGGLFSSDTLQVVVNPTIPLAASSQLAFWTNEGVVCLCTGDPIKITVNNTTQVLTEYFYGHPVTICNDNRAIRFDLVPGTYSWKAVRGIDTASGSVTIGTNSCLVQEVKF